MEGLADYDEYKRMFIETNLILLSVTFVVSMLHSVFEFMAFKNDIAFWREKDSMEGISVKTLYMQLGMSVIIALYLLDNETSLMISAPHCLGIALDLWKLKKASKVVKTETFPYFRLEDSKDYAGQTKEYDKIAMKYMSWAMFPMMGIYTIYSVMYKEHKGWYSFILNTLVGGIYVFGFIQMTP